MSAPDSSPAARKALGPLAVCPGSASPGKFPGNNYVDLCTPPPKQQQQEQQQLLLRRRVMMVAAAAAGGPQGKRADDAIDLCSPSPGAEKAKKKRADELEEARDEEARRREGAIGAAVKKEAGLLLGKEAGRDPLLAAKKPAVAVAGAELRQPPLIAVKKEAVKEEGRDPLLAAKGGNLATKAVLGGAKEALAAKIYKCEICIEDFDIADMTLALTCGHTTTCKGCFGDYCRSKIKDALVSSDDLKCPALGCKVAITASALNLLSPETNKVLDRFRLRNVLNAKGSGFRGCPSCDWFAEIPTDPGSEPVWRSVQCPQASCGARFCGRCGEKPHRDGGRGPKRSCEEVADARRAEAEVNADEGLGEYRKGKMFQKCPQCGRAGELEGCKFVYCMCRCKFCFLCGVELGERHHYSHFGAAGPYGDICLGPNDPEVTKALTKYEADKADSAAVEDQQRRRAANAAREAAAAEVLLLRKKAEERQKEENAKKKRAEEGKQQGGEGQAEQQKAAARGGGGAGAEGKQKKKEVLEPMMVINKKQEGAEGGLQNDEAKGGLVEGIARVWAFMGI